MTSLAVSRTHRGVAHASAFLLMTASPAIALAQSTAIPETPGIAPGAILQMVLGLLLIIGLVFVAAWLLRRVAGGKAFGKTGPLRVIGGLVLGPRERIVMIEVDETWIVVGIVPGQIKTLHTLPKGQLDRETDSETGFAHWLKQVTERRNA